MGAIIAMGVLSAGADGEVDQPDRRQPVLALRSRRPDRRRRLPATYPATSRTRQACSHVPWRQLTPDWSIRSRSRPPSPQRCAGGREGRHMAYGHVER
jgi:hypothetical protein